MKTVDELISHWVNSTPDAAAMRGPGQNPLSYAALGVIIAETRATLGRNGLGRNDRIAIVHSGGAEMAVALAAVACCATVVILDPNLTAAEFFFHLHDKEVKAIALEAGLASPIRAVAEKQKIPIIEIVCRDKKYAGKIYFEGSINNNREREIEIVRGEDDIVVFSTSGTTGYGKIVPLAQQEYVTVLARIVNFLEITPNDVALNVMPLFHSGGFSAGLMACLSSGASFLPIKNNDMEILFQCLKEQNPTFITGGYTFFHSLERKSLEYRDVIDSAKSHIRMLRTGAGHLDQKIADSLEEIFDAPVVEAYASSEAGFISCAGIPPSPRKPGSVGRPDPERVSILNENGDIVPAKEKGEIVVCKDTVFRGYENNSLANQMVFKNNWYLTGDEGFMDADGFLFITGRLKDTINRGGLKITPAEVDQAMMRHPAVREAISYPLPHPTLGENIGAAIVTKGRAELTSSEIQNFLKQYLAPFKIPTNILFVDEIPKSATGKVQRKKLCSQLGNKGDQNLAPKAVRENTSTPSKTESKLQEIWQSALGLDKISLTDNFFALGGDSLQAIDLFLRIEKSLDQQLPRDILFEAGTIAEMAQLLENGSSGSCIVPIKPEGNRPPFFCIHPIEGEVLGYRTLAGYLEQEQPFYGVQQMGANNQILNVSSIEDMANYYLDELRKIQPTGPYYLGGHSFGGLVAYVIAQKLWNKNEETALLALFDTYAPISKRNTPFFIWLKIHKQTLSNLTPAEKLSYIFQRIRNIFNRGIAFTRYKLLSVVKSCFKYSSMPSGPLLGKRDINVLNKLKFTPTPYEGNVVLFATERPASFNSAVHDEWKNLVKGNLQILRIPGGHLGIMQEPNVKVLARELTNCLNEQSMTCSREASSLLG